MKPSHHADQESRQTSSTLAHLAWLGGGCFAALFSISKSLPLFSGACSWPWLTAMITVSAAYMAADLGTGIYHWSIDNYGTTKTPLLRLPNRGVPPTPRPPVGDHQRSGGPKPPPGGGAGGRRPLSGCPTFGDPVVLMFLGVFGLSVIFSQQFHAWSHTPKGRLPAAVVAVQEAGIILRRDDHAAHHRRPFNSNYCIVSGVWNGVLDRSRFFVGMEMVVMRVLGYTPRSWSDPNPDEGNSGRGE